MVSHAVYMGCDPEIFISLNDKIVGSEKAIPQKGLSLSAGVDKITRDGVQVEFNPKPQTCRAYLGNHIRSSFVNLVDELKKKGMDINFDQVIKISKKELNSLSDESRKFGCAPSTNIYTNETSVITKDPSVYLKRSAGGHIHLGSVNYEENRFFEPSLIVPVLDIIVGNTCVLIDRDPANVERRKTYGRAGEYRRIYSDKERTKVIPGRIEYRTLSNFWLRNYKLMSFVMGLSRLSYSIVCEGLYNELVSYVDLKRVEKAINKNNFNLAWDNWLAIKPFFNKYLNRKDYEHVFVFHTSTLHFFEYFVAKGLDFWFPKNNILKTWTDYWEGHGNGWESFLNERVKEEYNRWITGTNK